MDTAIPTAPPGTAAPRLELHIPAHHPAPGERPDFSYVPRFPAGAVERPDIAVPAVRALVPGLCHFKPRLGLNRLVDVPRTLRWRDPSIAAQDLSDVPLLI